MRLVETTPEDIPDPRIELGKQVQQMPVPVIGLLSQPALEDPDLLGITRAHNGDECTMMTVSVNYTLWRNPDDRLDPVNLAELDDATRNELDELPPHPLPEWLLERRELMRYPQLWEAVRTSWNRESSERTTVRALLVDHVNHILINQFRQEYWPGIDPWDAPSPVITERSVNEHVRATIDGVEVPGAEIDTDPFVYGIGATLDNGSVVTAVVPRDTLDFVTVQFETRRPCTLHTAD